MPRPAEYDALLRIGSFKPAAASPASIAQFMRTAQDMLTATAAPMPDSARFLLAYEGMFNVVMAVLEFHEVRPGDAGGHRATAIQRVAADLQLNAAQQSVLARLHDMRNRVTYRAPLPPISKADADAMQAVLQALLPAARALIEGTGPAPLTSP
ncbi:MAG: hypothetical protein EKK53_14740 [Burkholderiales bacterium]|nr:MAG: hypothetical protein EKK53_14740 [Burkholderiales bacterium]